jgi:transglutaminase-like putative cysteine protease
LWFEAYLGETWHTFDPRNNTSRIGRILIARGRDAADVALNTRVRSEHAPEFLGSRRTFRAGLSDERVATLRRRRCSRAWPGRRPRMNA